MRTKIHLLIPVVIGILMLVITFIAGGIWNMFFYSFAIIPAMFVGVGVIYSSIKNVEKKLNYNQKKRKEVTKHG